ncbi:MAG: helix-turn-helix domain-containing protein [Mycolicibacterium insubricum]
MTHRDTVYTREELLRQVWRWDFGDLSTVTVHVKRLRAKLGEHHRIQTVWGPGLSVAGRPCRRMTWWRSSGGHWRARYPWWWRGPSSSGWPGRGRWRSAWWRWC